MKTFLLDHLGVLHDVGENLNPTEVLLQVIKKSEERYPTRKPGWWSGTGALQYSPASTE